MNKIVAKIFNKRVASIVLTGLGSLGVVATGYLSVRCNKKAETKETTKDKVIAYIPAAACGASTIACIIGSHYISAKELAAMTAAASYAVANRDKLKRAVEEKIGRNELRDIQTSSRVIPHCQNIEWTGRGSLKCLEGYSGRIFYSSLDAVKNAEETLMRRFQNGEYVSLNDFYELLGIEKTHFGHQFGWAANYDYYEYDGEHPIEFENTLVKDADGEVVLLIDVYTYPMEGWLEV